MKIKKRIKRALAAFLQEELLESMGYNHSIHPTSLGDRFQVQQIPFETLVMEQEVDINPGDGYEQSIDQCKKYFASEILKHIHVETKSLLDPRYMMRRSIRLTLRVQAKQ